MYISFILFLNQCKSGVKIPAAFDFGSLLRILGTCGLYRILSSFSVYLSSLGLDWYAPAAMPEGCSRLVFENVDGFRNNISGNDKLDKAKEAGSGSYYE